MDTQCPSNAPDMAKVMTKNGKDTVFRAYLCSGKDDITLYNPIWTPSHRLFLSKIWIWSRDFCPFSRLHFYANWTRFPSKSGRIFEMQSKLRPAETGRVYHKYTVFMHYWRRGVSLYIGSRKMRCDQLLNWKPSGGGLLSCINFTRLVNSDNYRTLYLN